MSIETQTPQIRIEMEPTVETVTSVGLEAYMQLSDAITRALLENDITGEREGELHVRDEKLGMDMLVHGDTPVAGANTAPAIIIDNLKSEGPDSFKRLVIQDNGSIIENDGRILSVTRAKEMAAFAGFVVTLPRVGSHE